MVRERIFQTVKYGQFREAMQALSDLADLVEKKGMKRPSFWSPLAGQSNALIMEVEYESLAEWERENTAFYSDPELMAGLRSAVQYIVEGSAYNELLETAPSLA
jgi:hypothetical protein